MNDDPTMNDLRETTAQEAAEFTAPLTDAAATVSRTAQENVGLTLIGGLAVGLAVGALLPFGRRRKPAKKASALAANLLAGITELSQSLAAQARDRAESTTDDAREKLDSASRTIGKSVRDHSDNLGKQTKKVADDATHHLNDGGKAIARQVIKLVEKARR